MQLIDEDDDDDLVFWDFAQAYDSDNIMMLSHKRHVYGLQVNALG